MKKYTDGEREIMITDRAYEVIYKNQGFKEKKIEENIPIDEVNEEEMKIKKSTKKK